VVRTGIHETTEKLGFGQLLSGFRFVQNIAPLSLSRDRLVNKYGTNKQNR